MQEKEMEITQRLSELGFDDRLKKKVQLFFEGSLEPVEEQKIRQLILFMEEVLDEHLFKKRGAQCPP